MDSTPFLPSTKRVRWDDSVPADVLQTYISSNTGGTAGSNDHDTQAARPSTLPPSCSANEAIRLCSELGGTWLGAASDGEKLKDDGKNTRSEDGYDGEGFRPEFTHQLFDEERIEGFEEGAIAIRVLYTPTSLDFLVKIQTREARRCAAPLSHMMKVSDSPAGSCATRSFYPCLQYHPRQDFKPPGARIHEYKREKKTFSVYRATGDDPGACEYHERAQCLAPWFIEAADAIDLTDDRWEVFYLFEEETPRQVLGEKWRPAALVGYFTVFGFRNPVKGISLRVCQALVLPQFQRQGMHP
ncbi:unnamed protein product [Hapterophycus canaliculatus]